MFNYTVITSGSTVGCNSTFDGILTINEKGKLSLLVPGTNDQSLCADTGTPISDITYTIGGAATGATVVFSPATPNGITYSVTGTTIPTWRANYGDVSQGALAADAGRSGL